jgi:CheY-like chemotaxis protein
MTQADADDAMSYPPAPAGPMSHRAGHGETIVVVDDTIEIRELLAEVLSLEGFRVVPCPDPLDALDTVVAERPALVIVDLTMAGVDGLAVVDQLAADPRTRATPFLICSGAVSEIHAVEAQIRSLGGDVLAKPFDLELLIRKVGTLTGTASTASEE